MLARPITLPPSLARSDPPTLTIPPFSPFSFSPDQAGEPPHAGPGRVPPLPRARQAAPSPLPAPQRPTLPSPRRLAGHPTYHHAQVLSHQPHLAPRPPGHHTPSPGPAGLECPAPLPPAHQDPRRPARQETYAPTHTKQHKQTDCQAWFLDRHASPLHLHCTFPRKSLTLPCFSFPSAAAVKVAVDTAGSVRSVRGRTQPLAQQENIPPPSKTSAAPKILKVPLPFPSFPPIQCTS